MSSLTLSPRTYTPLPAEEPKRSKTSIRLGTPRSTRPIALPNGHYLSPDQQKKSTVAKQGDASVSARTRSRGSTSPDKLAFETRSAIGDASMANGDDATHHTTLPESAAPREFEGEDEVDGYDDADSEDVYEPQVTKKNTVGSPATSEQRSYKIKFSFRGKKRKATDDDVSDITTLDILDQAPPSSAPTSPARDREIETKAEPEREASVAAPSEVGSTFTQNNEITINKPIKSKVRDDDATKRAPRKKRKWLKKGEVDPDDPEAVARQREKHRIIDVALQDLDRQYELVMSGQHESLKALHREVSLRHTRLTAQLEQRYKHAMEELDHMRKHAVAQTKFEFLDRRESLVDEMNTEDRRRKHKLRYEHIVHKVIDNTYPASRDGRGGGGWQFYPSDALSKHTEKLVPSGIDYTGVRRDVSLEPTSLAREIAQADITKIHTSSSEKLERSHGSTSKTRPAQSSRGRQERPRTLAEVLHKTPVEHPYIKAITQTKSISPSSSHKLTPAPYRPVPHPSLVAPAKKPDPPRQSSSTPRYYNATRGDARYLVWEDYRALAKYDAWGCPLPHDRQRRDLVLKESWEKMQGKIPRDSLQNPTRMIPLDGGQSAESGQSNQGGPSVSSRPKESQADTAVGASHLGAFW